MVLKRFLKGTFQNTEGVEMSLIVPCQFLASPVGREFTSNGVTPMTVGTETVAWWYAKI
jgi:hypothetical protein